jgi:hypothetical protein
MPAPAQAEDEHPGDLLEDTQRPGSPRVEAVLAGGERDEGSHGLRVVTRERERRLDGEGRSHEVRQRVGHAGSDGVPLATASAGGSGITSSPIT